MNETARPLLFKPFPPPWRWECPILEWRTARFRLFVDGKLSAYYAECASIAVQYGLRVSPQAGAELYPRPSAASEPCERLISAFGEVDKAAILPWLDERKRFRRKHRAVHQKIRDQPATEDGVTDA